MLQDMRAHRAVVLGEHEEDGIGRAFRTVRQQIAQLVAERKGSEHVGLVDMAGHAVPLRLRVVIACFEDRGRPFGEGVEYRTPGQREVGTVVLDGGFEGVFVGELVLWNVFADSVLSLDGVLDGVDDYGYFGIELPNLDSVIGVLADCIVR